MIFQIDFNHENDDETLKQVATSTENANEYNNFFVDLATCEDLQKLVNKVNEIKNTKYPKEYVALVDFTDKPFIYFDNDN